MKWSKDGSKEGDLVFVAGHPGRTDRLNTLASLDYLRDIELPLRLDYIKVRETFLLEYGRRSDEAYRQSKEELFTYQNSRKARVGGLEGLRDPAFMKHKADAERELRARVVKAADRHRDGRAAAWDKVAAAQKVAARIVGRYFYLERGYAFNCELFNFARDLVRLAEEKTRPNSDRLKEYRESALKSLDLGLFSEAPIYAELERVRLAHSLAQWKRVLPEDRLIDLVLQGRSPVDAARQIVDGTALADVNVRRKFAAGGKPAIEASTDPMIKLALLVDPAARAVRKVHEDEVEGVEASNYALIARSLFDEKGDAVYPDATFTLRLSYGTVKGYAIDGRSIPAYTTFAGAFNHSNAHNNEPPYRLPPSWVRAREKGKLVLDTPFSFVSTADIIGGNSGSPVVSRDNEVVGLIFDGNIQSLVLDFGYDDKIARAVAIDSRAITEALHSVYQADGLVKELKGQP